MRRALWALLLLSLAGSPAGAADPLRIGVLTDESGPYADSAGSGSITAARMAAEDAGGTVLGRPIEIVHGDTQNKPDVASTIARRWFDNEGVAAIVDLPVTPVALAVQQLAKEKDRTVMVTASAASEFTTRFCSPVSSHWADDTHALAGGTARAVVAGGGDRWFFITVDMAFGLALERDATDVIRAGGGQVLGSAKFPIGATDFSSILLQAQATGARVIGLASVGTDLVNAVKQASEFGLGRASGQTLAAFLVYIQDVHALGLQVAQGLTFTAGFYWDQDDASRAFAQRFFAREHKMPSKNHAMIYAAVSHYLRSVVQAGTDEAVAANRAMRATPFSLFGRAATVRADGRVMYDTALWRVKAPAESHGEWDLYAFVRTIGAADAFLPENKPVCSQ